jgi:hypothetical protein
MAYSVLQGVQSPNAGQGLLDAFSSGQDIRAKTLTNQARQQGLGEGEYQASLRKIQIANKLAQKALTLQPEGRMKLMQDYYGALQAVGFTPEDLAGTPLDDAGLQNLIAQTDSVLRGSGVNNATDVQQSHLVPGLGFLQQLRNGQINLAELTPEQQAKVKAALEAEAAIQAEAYGLKTRTGLEVRTSLEPTLKGAVTEAQQRVMGATEPQIQSEIERQKQAAKLAEVARADAIKSGNKYTALLSGFEEAKAIIPLSTGSSLGGLRDAAGRVVGYSTDAAQNTARLKSLAAWLVTQVPKSGGAVSDADLAQFINAVGKIDDNTPTEERMAAIDTAKTIVQMWRGQLDTGSGNGAMEQGAPRPNVKITPEESEELQMLKSKHGFN